MRLLVTRSCSTCPFPSKLSPLSSTLTSTTSSSLFTTTTSNVFSASSTLSFTTALSLSLLSTSSSCTATTATASAVFDVTSADFSAATSAFSAVAFFFLFFLFFLPIFGSSALFVGVTGGGGAGTASGGTTISSFATARLSCGFSAVGVDAVLFGAATSSTEIDELATFVSFLSSSSIQSAGVSTCPSFAVLSATSAVDVNRSR